MSLAGKVVLVTGGGKGIGLVLAQAFGSAGARVVLTGRSESALAAVARQLELAGAEAMAVSADAADERQVAAAVARAQDRFGPVSILVNNAGIPGPTRNLWEIEPHEWDEVLAVNLRGAFLFARATLPGMIAGGWGRIINISSILGRNPPAMRSPYAASKMGLVAMTRSLAQEAGPYGVTVNLVSPGAVAGDRLDLVQGRQAAAMGLTLAELREKTLGSTPVRRLVEADDVAAAVLFLASEAAGGMTGEDLNVTGGRVMW